MFIEDKVTEIFCIADDFCKFYDAMMAKYTVKAPNKRPYHCDGTLSKAEVMLIMFFAKIRNLNQWSLKINEYFCTRIKKNSSQ